MTTEAVAAPRSSEPWRPEPIRDGHHWVEIFTAMWSHGNYRDMSSYAWAVHPECRIQQPLAPVTYGPEGFLDQFKRLHLLLPDATATIRRGLGNDRDAYVEFRLEGTLAGKRIGWDVVDTYVFEEGQVIERIAYFDSVEPLLQLLRRPRGWLRWWQSGVGYPTRPMSRSLLRKSGLEVG
jgi:hypothetical protein